MEFEERISRITKKKLQKRRAPSKKLLKNSLVRSTATGMAANIPRAVLKYLEASAGDNLYFTLSKTGIHITKKAPKVKGAEAFGVMGFISHRKGDLG